ncbi:hypothetical protein BASA60_006505 [Batrachochytrium salamandrivorans]|nr:hypothetical protein BASA60_006505 [Batrachochytrium salamandrivorans]
MSNLPELGWNSKKSLQPRNNVFRCGRLWQRDLLETSKPEDESTLDIAVQLGPPGVTTKNVGELQASGKDVYA